MPVSHPLDFWLAKSSAATITAKHYCSPSYAAEYSTPLEYIFLASFLGHQLFLLYILRHFSYRRRRSVSARVHPSDIVRLRRLAVFKRPPHSLRRAENLSSHFLCLFFSVCPPCQDASLSLLLLNPQLPARRRTHAAPNHQAAVRIHHPPRC